MEPVAKRDEVGSQPIPITQLPVKQLQEILQSLESVRSASLFFVRCSHSAGGLSTRVCRSASSGPTRSSS